MIKLAIGIAATVVGLSATPSAHADPITYAGDDSYQATCTALGKHLDGNVVDDSNTLIGVSEALADEYHLSLTQAAQVVNYQVETYCPRYWPNLVAVGRAARGTGV